MNEEMVEKLVSDISDNPEAAKILLDFVERCIVLHRCAEKKMMDFILFSGPFPTKEGGEASLEALRRTNDDNEEKKKLEGLKSYWLENYDDIKKVIGNKGPLR